MTILGPIALTSDGLVFICKVNSTNKSWIPINTHGCKIQDIHTSEINAFFMAYNRRLFALSSNHAWSQLGTGKRTSAALSDISTRVETEEVKTPSEDVSFGTVRTGYGHSYFLSHPQRYLYGAGNNTYGQLGAILGEKERDVPILIPEFERLSVKKLVSGFANCLLMLDNNFTYVFGYNGEGQLGYDVCDNLQPIPLRIDGGGIVKDAFIGQSVGIVVTMDGSVFASGLFNPNKQLCRFTKIDMESRGFTKDMKWMDVYTGIDHNIVFSCRGKHCGSSSYVFVDFFYDNSANKRFNITELTLSPPYFYEQSKRFDYSQSATHSCLFFRNQDDMIQRHFIWRFNERLDYCDIGIVQCW